MFLKIIIEKEHKAGKKKSGAPSKTEEKSLFMTVGRIFSSSSFLIKNFCFFVE